MFPTSLHQHDQDFIGAKCPTTQCHHTCPRYSSESHRRRRSREIDRFKGAWLMRDEVLNGLWIQLEEECKVVEAKRMGLSIATETLELVCICIHTSYTD